MIHVVTWFWGSAYQPYYVQRLAFGVRRNTTVPYRFVCVTDAPKSQFGENVDLVTPIRDQGLTKIKGCFCRLRLFDPLWQQELGISAGDCIVNLDLDAVVTGNLDAILTRQEPFVILQGVNSPSHPCAYNGSIFSFYAGYRPDVWQDFSLEAAARIPKSEFADDQGWVHHMIPNAAAYGPSDGIWAYSKGPWSTGPRLPEDARLVAFPGRRDPLDYLHCPWVREHWLEAPD